MRDLILGLTAFSLGAAYTYQAAQIPRSALGDAVGAGGVPQILGLIMCLCGVMLIVQSLWLRRAGNYVPEAISEVFADPRHLMVFAGGVVVCTIAYFFLLNLVGYIVAMTLYLTAIIRLQGVAFSMRSGLVALLGAVGLWLLFDIFLGINLPTSAF